MPVYIEKSGDLVGCYHSGTNEQPNNRTRKDRATQPMDHGRLRRAKGIVRNCTECEFIWELPHYDLQKSIKHD